MGIPVLNDLDLEENSILLSKIEMIGAGRLLGNIGDPLSDPPGNIMVLYLGTGLEFEGNELRTKKGIPVPNQSVQFIATIPPATDMNIFVDGITDNYLVLRNNKLSIIEWKARLYKNAGLTYLLSDDIGHSGKIKYANSVVENIGNNIMEVISDHDMGGGVFTPEFVFDGNDVNLHIDYTGGKNTMPFNVTLVVDVIVSDYPI